MALFPDFLSHFALYYFKIFVFHIEPFSPHVPQEFEPEVNS